MNSSNAFRKLTAGLKLKKPKMCHPERNEGSMKPTEILGDVRQSVGIDVEGDDVPNPILTFNDMEKQFKIPQCIMNNLEKAKFYSPTPIQMQAIPLLMDRREVMCSAPTGSGKTLAFLLPIIIQLKKAKSKGFRAIILAPTRELAKQLHREFLWIAEGTGLRIHIINDVGKAKEKFDSKLALKKDILITTPKRLMILLEMEPPVLDLSQLRWLIIDECDKLFETAFKEQLSFIYKACSLSKHVRRAMFSATFDDDLQEWFKMNLDNVVSLIVGGKNTPANSVNQTLEYVGNEDGKLYSLKNHIFEGLDAPVLIFVEHKDAAKRLFKELITQRINAESIHSDRLTSERDKIVQQFRDGRILFLICTELMGRGIDFKAVNTIINYDCPSSMTAYIHRVGRTGRGGRVGKAITFYTDKDIPKLRKMADVLVKAGCDVPASLVEEGKKDKSLKSRKRKASDKGKWKKKKKKKFTRNDDSVPE